MVRDAYWRHVSSIFTFDDDVDPPHPDSPQKVEKLKSFGHLSSPIKKDASGITSLRENIGILKSDIQRDKANICNLLQQFLAFS